jgi:hypothetical protein
MTFADWVRETAHRYRTQPVGDATRRSAQKFAVGASRRVLDPHVGDVWWGEDWDVLVILDGMRVDQAREVLGDEAAIDTRWSAASTSIDWIERHFDRRYRDQYRETAYVTANPFASNDSQSAKSADLDAKDLSYLDCVYRDAFEDVNGAVSTTPPEVVTRRAIHAWRRTDCNRLIVHYMQPHQPFRSRPEWEGVFSNLENLVRDVNQGGADIWKRCRDGEIDRDELWAAYCDNLRWVWESVESELLRNVDGDVTITADHGNGMGEWGVWSHAGGQLTPQVRKVPVWTTTARDTETVAGEAPPTQSPDASTDDQLAALGYKA